MALTTRVYVIPAAKQVMEAWGWRADSDGEHISLPHHVNAHDIRIVVSALEDLHLVCYQKNSKQTLKHVISIIIYLFPSHACVLNKKIIQTEEQRRHKLVVEAERRKIKEREERDHAERERIKQQMALDRLEVSKEEHRDSV